jgi:2-C-methyl-D-erythritol 4-phosphate cytidylyltransferase
MNTAIIAAAGSGQRFNSDIPKQFIEIGGKPILLHSIERFAACELVNEIVVVVAADQIEGFSKRSDVSAIRNIKFIAGASSRAESVYNGLMAVDAATEIVAVHDGARPLVKPEEIARTIERARETGAACLTAPVTDTIKEVDEGWITGTVDRRMLRRAMTPQAFKYELLVNAFRGRDLGDDITDECYLVEQLGHKIASVAGGTRNMKITHSEDLVLAEAFLLSESLGK